MFVPVPQGELIDEHRAQCKAAGVDQPFRRDLAVCVEDALERTSRSHSYKPLNLLSISF